MNSKVLYSAFVLFLLIGLITYIILDEIFREDLRDSNADLVEKLQKDNSSFTKNFFTVITQLGYAYEILAILIIAFEFSNEKIQIFYLIIIQLFNAYGNGILKMAYSEPRPYMEFSQVIPIDKCNKECGKPSGHSMATIYLYCILLHLIVTRFKNHITNKKFLYFLIIAVTVIFLIVVFLIGWSRIYLGAHSYSYFLFFLQKKFVIIAQVILGWIYGIAFILLHECILLKYFSQSIIAFFKSPEPRYKRSKLFLLLLFVSFICCELLSFLLYALQDHDIPESIQKNIIACAVYHNKPNPDKYVTDNFFLLEGSFLSAAVVSLPFGALFAICLNSGTYITNYNNPPSIKFYIRILRILVLGVIIAICFFPFAYISTDSVYKDYIIQSMQQLLIGFFTFYLQPYVYFKLRLAYPGDFLYLQKNMSTGQTPRQENVVTFWYLSQNQQGEIKTN